MLNGRKSYLPTHRKTVHKFAFLHMPEYLVIHSFPKKNNKAKTCECMGTNLTLYPHPKKCIMSKNENLFIAIIYVMGKSFVKVHKYMGMSWSKPLYPVLITGSTQGDPSQHD